MKPYTIFWIAVILVVGYPVIMSLLGNLKEMLSERKQKKLNAKREQTNSGI